MGYTNITVQQYRVQVDYQTVTGGGFYTWVGSAANVDQAIDEAHRACRRKRRVMKFIGGTVEVI